MTAKIRKLTQGNEKGNSILYSPILPSVLKKLLEKSGVSVSAGALAESCDNFQPMDASLKPVQRLMGILTGVGQRQLQVCLLQWDRLDRRYLPALVFYQNHWTYVEPDTDDTVCLTPPEGPSFSAFAKDLEQAPVLWLRSPPEKSTVGQLMKSPATRLLHREIWKDKGWLFEVLGATVIINILAVASSLFAMQIYDRVVPTFAYATLTALVAGMMIVMVLDWSMKFIRARITDNLAKQVDQAVSQHLFEHVMALRLDTRPRSLGTLAAQMNSLEQVRNFFSSTIIFFMADLPFCYFFMGVIYIIGKKVSFVYAVLFPLALILGWVAQRRLKKLAKEEIQKGHERHGLLVEVIQGAETIQATGSGWRFAEHWKQITATMAGYGFKNKSITSTAIITTGSLGTLGYVGALVLGVTCVEAGELTTGGMIACAILGGRIIAPVGQSVRFMVQWQHVKESLEMVNRLLEMEPDRRSGQDLLFPDSLPDRVELEKVRFAYPNSPVICIDIPELTLNSGERLVILGPNGCGKSTLLKIMAGLYKPVEGQVRLGATNLFDLDIQIVNQRIGYLPQDVHLFKGTLKTNMALSGGIPDGALLEVAKLLGIDRIAAQNPRSMELKIFEGGQGLSGGQRQLAALARLFLARPRIWLLDEPSAALDLESEDRVLEALQQWTRPSDIVVIASHRPRLTCLATRVIVLGQGKILANGKPGEIIKQPRMQYPRIQPI